MARIIEKLEEWVTYVPEFEGNRDDEDPIIMELSFITPIERDSVMSGMPAELTGPQHVERAKRVVRRILSQRVRNIKNYTYLGVVIENGEVLADCGESELVNEVFGALTKISSLREGLKKK